VKAGNSLNMGGEEAQVTDRRALVAIDLGAESCRVSLLRWLEDSPQIELIYRFPNDAVQRPDGLYWDMRAILAELDIGLRRCAELATEGIRSIAVDGWAVDYVRLESSTGNAVADPFCYRDRRTSAAQVSLHQRISAERMRELTGIQIMALNTVYQKAADDDSSRKLRWLNLPEYVLYTMGARPVAELTNATHTQMVGLDNQWSQEILDALGAPRESMPEIVPAGTNVGWLNSALQELPAFRSTQLIAPACHDTASAIASIPDSGDDWAYISSGTWSLVGTVLRTPVNTAEARAQNFTNLGGVDNTVCFHKNVNGMWLLRQALESWNSDGGTESPNLTIAAVIEAAAHHCSQPELRRRYLLDVDDPDLLLSGRMPERINAQLRRRGLPVFDTSIAGAPELAAFLFQSLAARYAEVLTSVAAITGKQIRKLYLMGGGSQNELLNCLTSEVTGLEVIRAGTECSTVGNFAVQLSSLEATSGPGPTARWARKLVDASSCIPK
jgi:rhamnulokinase